MSAFGEYCIGCNFTASSFSDARTYCAAQGNTLPILRTQADINATLKFMYVLGCLTSTISKSGKNYTLLQALGELFNHRRHN